MFIRSAKSHGPIAVDIGSGCLHLAQAAGRGGKLTVQAWCELPLENPAPASNKESEKQAVTKAPMPGNWPMLDRTRFAGNEVVVSINPPDVECAPLRVPDSLLKLEHSRLLAAIRHEVSRTISLPVEEVEMDVWRLKPGAKDSPNLMVAAARRDLIAAVLAWLDGQKLICRRIEVGPLAALRTCARLAQGPADDQLWGVLDVGRSAARLYIGVGETPVYVRCTPRGGEEMTRRISEELGVEPKVAESYKRHYGVHSEDGHHRSDSRTSAGDAVDSRRMAGILLGALRPTIRGIGEEIQRSFRYAMGLYPERSVAGLWVVGGGGELGGLPELLAELLGIPVRRVSHEMLPASWAVPAASPEAMVLRSANCLGLCLGEMN